ncbi:MAG: DUF1097 domain-containing protein [Parvibaculaceae bacterium]
MDLVTALAIVIGVMGGLATWLVLGPLAVLALQIWAIFIAWGCFYHCGGGETGLKNTIVCGIWGAVCASVALMLVTTLAGSMGVAVAAGILVGITVAIMILGSKAAMLSTIPAAVYGYASTAAYALLSGVALGEPAAVIKAMLIVVASLIVGAVLGYISQKIAVGLSQKAVTTAKV